MVFTSIRRSWRARQHHLDGGPMSALEHLGVVPAGTRRWQAHAPEALHGAYGGAFGGLLAAIAVAVARETVPGRHPFALDCHFVRGLRGDASITTDVVRSGRSMSVVSVAMTEGGELTTSATVLLADLAALDDWTVADTGAPPPDTSDAKPWRHPPGRHVGIIDTLAPRSKRVDGDAIATTISVPWPTPGHAAAAEASCMAADISTGPPVEAAFTGGWRPHPNPDLSLRFLPRPISAGEITGVARLDAAGAGVATMSLAVWSGGARTAVGVSTALVSPPVEESRR
jgi:acyl-coenzyme A thioesterase PaaI-like protein